jgi:hypothetical protein
LVHGAGSIDHVSVIALFVLFIGIECFADFRTGHTSVASEIKMFRLDVTVQVIFVFVDVFAIGTLKRGNSVITYTPHHFGTNNRVNHLN